MSDEREHSHHREEDDHQGRRHSHAPANFGKAFGIGVTLNAAFVILEAVYGLFAHSLALVADAGHNLGDVFGLLLAWAATAWARRPPTARRTYGWRRSSIFAALGNAAFLLVGVGVISWEAVRRLRNPSPVQAQTMIWVSVAGMAVNTITALMFMAGRKGDLNLRAAFLHNAGDALISAGLFAAGVAIACTGWLWLDPVVGLILALVIVVGTWGLLRDSANLALDAVPSGIDMPGIREYLASLPAVVNVHHLHVWGLSTSDVALTAHLVLAADGRHNALLDSIHRDLDKRFGIGHATIQLEAAGHPECPSKECRASSAG